MTSNRRLKILSPAELNRLVCVVLGTRPGIIKQSPVIRALQAAGLDFFVVHTGQHYSYEMDAAFFRDLDLPAPKYRLESVREHWTHGGQTAEMLKGVEEALLEERPRVVIVGGDANTNLAGALAARKLQLHVGHVEAGLRSGDWRMPEEHNRVMIDHISDFLFAPTENARQNLVADAVRGRIFVTGNTIVDAVHQNAGLARERSDAISRLGLDPGEYLVVTTHREETVDTEPNLNRLIGSLEAIAADHPEKPIVLPLHPRTANRFVEFGLRPRVDAIATLRVMEPLGYLDFLLLMSQAAALLTDSGGIQEEGCILGVPCVTLRDNTERPETVEVGANFVAGLEPASVSAALERALTSPRGWRNPFGDGTAGDQIVGAIRETVCA